MHSITPVLNWIETSPVGLFVAESAWGFSALLMLHIAAVTVLFGMILVVDLRLMGLASTRCGVRQVCRESLPWAWGAFLISAITGTLLFTGQAVKYSSNFAFQMKFLIMAIAGINMLVFQLVTYRGVTKWNQDARVPLAGKLAGAISLASWIAIVAYARWTAYYHL